MMNKVERIIADLNKCLSRDSTKYNQLHNAHYNAYDNKCIGGGLVDDVTKIQFYQIFYTNLTPKQYRKVCARFDTIVRNQFPGSGKYKTHKPMMPAYGQKILPKEHDYCVYTEDIYSALRQAII